MWAGNKKKIKKECIIKDRIKIEYWVCRLYKILKKSRLKAIEQW
jgi:hypothetical protein